MARPVNADAAATRAKILRAATRLFAEHGAGKTSMRSIARRAKVSLATVHHYFGNKEGLYDACVEAMYAEFDGLRAELLAEVPMAGSMRAALEEAVRRSYRFCRGHQLAVRLTTREAIERGEVDERRQQSLLVAGIGQAAQVLAALTGHPELELRLLVRDCVYLIVRYALTTPRELALILGLGEEEEAERVVEDHLVRASWNLLTGEMS